MPLSQTPSFNLRAVLKETGIAADTLRAWERRYGIPKPQRTPGGHRLYSQRDIHLIKWLMSRQAEGLSISQAVYQWNEFLASGADPLAESRAESILGSQAISASNTNLDPLRKEWLAASLAFNESTVEQILNQAFALYPVEIVTAYLIQHGLQEIGEMWYRGEASVQQEHFATALATRRLDALIAASPPPTHKETLLLACPPEEWHAFPLLLLNLLLRRRGWNTVYLGANVPLAQLEETAQSIQPRFVIMAAQQLVTAATIQETARLLAKKGFTVAYGGRIFNQVSELREHIAGEFLGETIETASERIEQLFNEQIQAQVEQGHGLKRIGKSKPGPVAQAYRLNRKLIESATEQQMAKAGISSEDLAVANLHFGNALGAALNLGNIAYLESDMDWIKNLLALHNLPTESLRSYLRAFSQSAQETMRDTASEVVDWLEGYISRI